MCWCFTSHCKLVLQELHIVLNCTIAAESLESMPVSLRRMALDHCASVPASSLASIGRLSALERLALDSLPQAGGDDALRQLAPQLPSGLTSLKFRGFTSCKVGVVPCERTQHSCEP